MGIKRYYATADNTISNSFSDDLITRRTLANAGKSDILEAYSIYGRASAESIELSRIVIGFDLEDLSLANQPAGSKYYLKLFNARHSESLPSDFTMVVRPLSQPWVEGEGLDLITYNDEDESNWLARQSDRVAQVITITTNTDNIANYQNQSISLFDGEGSRFNFYFKTDQEDSSQILVGTDVEVDLDGEVPAEKLEEVINDRPEFSATRNGNTVEVTNTIPGKTETPLASVFVDNAHQPDLAVTTSGVNYTPWSSPGGAFSTVLDAQQQEIAFEQSFATGDEDLEIDITAIVQEWLSDAEGSLDNNGLGIMLKAEFEDGSKAKSFYTKRFFARDSEFFLRRPTIEARFDNSIKDDSRGLITASPHKSNPGNTLRAYYQNLERGVPTDLATNPNFTLTTDKALVDKATLLPNNNGNAVLDSPNSDYTENAYVELIVANTAAFDDNNFANSLIRVSYTDAASGQENIFDFIGRYDFWNAPSERVDIFPVNVSNTLENRIAAAQAITDELNAYPGFSALFAAIASGETFRIYSKVQGNAGQNSSVSIHTVSTSQADFLQFNRTPAHDVDNFDPFVADSDPVQEGNQPSGNEYDSLEQLDAAAYENYKQASPITALLPNLALANATYNKSTRSFRGNAGVTADIIASNPVTGTTGLYVAEFKIANNITVETLYKKWWLGNDEEAGLLKGHNGNDPVSVSQWYNASYIPSTDLLINIQNLQNSYSKDDKVKLKIIASARNMTPNVVSVNKGYVSSRILQNCHFEVRRLSDDFIVIPYDFQDQSTRVSYDKDCNFIELDMSILEPGYTYGVRFLSVEGDNQVQNNRVFKFRVEK